MEINLKASQQLNCNRKDTGEDYDSYYDLKPNEYIYTTYNENLYGIIFKCPGCGEPQGIHNNVMGVHKEDSHWKIDFVTMTATPSILHDPKKGGCGWHGYLTKGILEAC